MKSHKYAQILTLLILAAIFGIALVALWSINTGALAIAYAWPWLLGLPLGAGGLLFIARDLK
jgi:hypothetical protein